MLGKLMKHEFKATSRLMAPLLLVVLGLAALWRVYDGILGGDSESWLMNMLQFLLFFAFIFALVAALICAVVLMVQRFAKNLLGDEGYLMFTLPVSQHSLILSKLFVSIVWFLVVIAVDILAVIIAAYQQGTLHDILEVFAAGWREMHQLFRSAHGWIVAELILLMLLSMSTACLQFYAPIAIGHSFARRKRLYSVIFFFVIQFIMQILGIRTIDVTTNYLSGWNIDIPVDDAAAIVTRQTQGFLLYSLATTAVAAAVLYLITWLMMKKRLNLQ